MVAQLKKVNQSLDWKQIKDHGFTELSLAETLGGGQSFVWEQDSLGFWRGVIANAVVCIEFDNDVLKWSSSESSFGIGNLKNYFWLEQSYTEAIDSLPWRSDSALESAIRVFSGLRILRQPVDEILFYFLLSPVKSIPQIKEMGMKVAEYLGPSVGFGKYGFPGWAKLGQVTEQELRELKLGYRAKSIVGVAKYLGERPDFLQGLQELPYQEAKSEIMKLPGVGPKVADCVLLFGCGKLEAFPIDTWIIKTLEKRYGLKGWKTDHMLHFAQKHFGGYAGLAQQFLFSGERLGIWKDRTARINNLR